MIARLESVETSPLSFKIFRFKKHSLWNEENNFLFVYNKKLIIINNQMILNGELQ